MAARYTVLLALAFTALAVIKCEDTTSALAPTPEKSPLISNETPTTPTVTVSASIPTTTETSIKTTSTPINTTPHQPGTCNAEQNRTIEKTWTDTLLCFSHLIKDESCQTAKNILEFNSTLISVLACTSSNATEADRVKTNVGTVLKMMNTTIADYKELVKNSTFSECIQQHKEELTNCVKKNIHGHPDTISNLGKFTAGKNLLSLNFNNSNAKGLLRDVQNCTIKVLNGDKKCTRVSDFAEALFKLAAQSAASIPVSSFLIMIGTFLFALYF